MYVIIVKNCWQIDQEKYQGIIIVSKAHLAELKNQYMNFNHYIHYSCACFPKTFAIFGVNRIVAPRRNGSVNLVVNQATEKMPTSTDKQN